MVERTFGAIKAAGTQIREVSGGRSITPAALGWAGFAGIFERGAVGEPIYMLTRKDAEAKIGGLIPESLAPDAVFDFMREANGAGGVIAVRVTDGNELPAEITLYARHSPQTPIGRLTAKNGGRWGGAEKRYTAVLADVADIGETTLETGVAMKIDEWKGASLALAGVPNASYKVTGNDATGILAVEADETMHADLVGGIDPTNGRYYLSLENGEKHLSIVISDGDDAPTFDWSLDVYLNGLRVIGWKNLSTDPASKNYWQSVINSDSANEYVTAIDEWSGSYIPSTRPANHYGTFTGITATSMTATIHDFVISGTGNPTIALGTTTDEMVAQTLTLTMTAATTFDAVSDVFGAVGSGTFGVLFTPANKWVPPFTITAGVNAMTVADEITIAYKPFKARSLIGGRLFPNKDSDRTLSYRIVDNTHKVITVAAGSTMSADVAPIGGVAATGSIQFATKANHVNGEKFVINDGSLGAITFWIDQDGLYSPPGGYNATNIRLDLSAATTNQEVAVVAQTAINAMPVSFKVTAGLPVGGLMALTNDATGTQGNVAITETVAHVSFIATGMTGGVTATVNEFMVEAALQMHGGRDGNSEIVDAHYELQAWSLDSSPYLKLRGRNMGLVKFATPGVTAAAVQKAGINFAYERNHSYAVEIPANITTADAADNYLTNTIGRSVKTAYAFIPAFPSYGYVADPAAPKKLKLITITGMALGYHAACARDNDGYHKAPAGVEAIMSKLVKLTTDVEIDGEFANPRGLNLIRKRQGNFVLWGDRTLQADDPEWTFAHQRWTMSHYENTLLENLDVFTFKINDPQTQSDAKVVLIAYFKPEWAKRALRGDKFEDACVIKIDAENNTAATMALGDMHASISLRIADTVERFIITIGKQGVNENVA
jgi:hypothetical protein